MVLTSADFLIGFPIGVASSPGPQDLKSWREDDEHLYFFLWNQGQLSKYTYPLVTDTGPNHGVQMNEPVFDCVKY